MMEILSVFSTPWHHPYTFVYISDTSVTEKPGRTCHFATISALRRTTSLTHSAILCPLISITSSLHHSVRSRNPSRFPCPSSGPSPSSSSSWAWKRPPKKICRVFRPASPGFRAWKWPIRMKVGAVRARREGGSAPSSRKTGILGSGAVKRASDRVLGIPRAETADASQYPQ